MCRSGAEGELSRREFLGTAAAGGMLLLGDMMTLLHRVVFYGDRLNAARDLAQLMGLKLVMEG